MRSNSLLVTATSLLWIVSGCNGTSTPGSSANPPGSVLDKPGSAFAPIFVDENASGRAPELKLVSVAYGRLVDVYAYDGVTTDPNSTLVPIQSQVVIRSSLVQDNSNYVLETDAVTGQENLIILRNISAPTGVQAMRTLLRGATEGLDQVFDPGFGQAGFYTMVPRNSTAVLIFDDLLDPETINSQTVEVVVGPAPFGPYDARILADPVHGDLQDFDGDGQAEFYSTRVLVDFTVNSFESFQSSPPLPLNPNGLRASLDQNRDNVQIRLATRLDQNSIQTDLLSNLTDHTLNPFANGSADIQSPTRDVVRAFRSGGRTEVTGDQYNGFLRDDNEPNVVAALPARLVTEPVQTSGDLFTVPLMTFSSTGCAQTPADGDFLFQTLTQGVLYARVEGGPFTDPDGFGTVSNFEVRVLAYPTAWDQAGAGVATWAIAGLGSAGPVQFLSAFDPSKDAGAEPCFLETFPQADGYPQFPSLGIASTASWGLRFNEPMDRDSFSAYDGMRLTRVNPNSQTLSAGDYAVTAITSSPDGTRVAVQPHFPLNHAFNQTESYFLSIVNEGISAPTDLAGNRLEFSFAPVEGALLGSSPVARNGTHVSLFTLADEEPPIADPANDPFPFAEWGGQHVYLTERGAIAPRPVSRFTQVVERATNPFTVAMAQLAGGVEEPLARMGSKTQILWRMYDLGLDLFDVDLSDVNNQLAPWRLERQKLNIDVERLYWTPAAGSVTFDSFAGFAMSLSHSAFLPDEAANVPMNIVFQPSSGLVPTFSQNQLSQINDVPKAVHFREDGYTLDPGEIINSPDGAVLMPWPMNMDPSRAKRYYTWRDTGLTDRAGVGGNGAQIIQWSAITGVGTGSWEIGLCDGTMFSNFNEAGEVQSSALPLLMEFRCYPDTSATTANRLDVSTAQGTTLQTPFFRSFSTGGFNVEQEPVFIDPDTQLTASGGFDPLSSPIPGVPTPGFDKNVYMGAVDFVVRVSRSYSVWFPTPDTTGTTIDAPMYFTPVVEPDPSDQAPGTSVEFAYRGSDAIMNAFPVSVDPAMGGFRMTAVAQILDPYGDHYTNDVLCADPLTMPPEPNAPWQFVVHNSIDSNIDNVGIRNGGAWFDDVSGINGAKFFQVRASFISNAETGISPVLSTFALGWRQ